MAAVDYIPLLRLYGNEPDQANFSDEDLEEILVRFTADTTTDVFLSAAELWGLKAARFAGLVDVSEGGASRKMSQAFQQATEMAEYYRGRSVAADDITVGSGITATNQIERI